ncbi:MAG TPA: transglutaminase-like domain-containing protein [Actinomycetota bacterium]|nr:transglutaminase-like domain-containing protein [Actinomycetota bacterium]
MNSEFDYYVTPGPITDLDGVNPDALRDLPEGPGDIARVVRGCLVDGRPVPEGRDDPQLRPARAMIERIVTLEPSPLVDARPADTRLHGTCRHFATLTCALLRYTGTPARVRAGFAGYFEPDVWVDHWIIEYWHPETDRWTRLDPEYGDDWFGARDPAATSESTAGTKYLSGTEAWQKCRSGELDPNRFKMGGVNWGIGEVRGSVLYDFAALNKDEMLPWDVWAQMEPAYRSETDAAYDDLLDDASATAIAGDLEAIRRLYENREELQVPGALAGRAAV